MRKFEAKFKTYPIGEKNGVFISWEKNQAPLKNWSLFTD